MPIASDFSISATGDIRHVSGTTVYSVLDLHAWLQALADDEAATGDDLLDIESPDPSALDGQRDAAVASRLNLLTEDAVAFNLDDDAAQYINFGSIKQDGGNVQYSGLKTIGGIVAASPVYVVQNGNKLTKFWADGHVQIMIKVRVGGTLIDSGNVTAFSRKWGQTYSHFDTNLAAGGESNAALSTAVDPAIVLTEVQAAALSSKVTLTFGDTTQDFGNGNGPKLYKGTIALSGGCTLQEAYQYLQYLTRENSSATLNGVPGWRYRVLNAAYAENQAAPFGTFAGGTFLFARGWWVSGVLAAEANNYQLIADDGSVQAPLNVVYQSVAISNGVPGTRLLIQDITNPASPITLYSGVPASFPHTWTDSAQFVADRDIRVRAAYQSGTSAKLFVDEEIGTVTLAAPALSYRLNQVDDAVYIANAINGAAVSGITIDDPTLLINVTASTISLQALYAYEVYWLSTAAGIIDEGRIITAPDTANYIFEGGWKIKNTSSPSVPLTITGGYMVDATTGTAISLIDTTGGTIFLAPPHVVPFATGSGVTAQDKADIAAQNAVAMLAAAQAAPIHADIRKVNNITVDGSGTEANPFGPA